MLTLQIRKTKKKKTPVVYGPLSVIKAGLRVKVRIADRDTEVTIRSLGKPFRVDGCMMVYGYFGGDGHTHHIAESLHDLGFAP